MAQQRQPGAPPCFPDQYLTQDQIDILFDDFRFGLSASLPDASVFSNLVNGVRQQYMTEILGLQRDIVRRSELHEKKLSELKEQYDERLSQVNHEREREREGTRPPVYAEEPVTREWRAGSVLPANTHTVHVGAALGPRRDMLGWASNEQEKHGWTERFVFKAFKFYEVGTIKIVIGQSSEGSHRSNAFLPNSTVPMGWGKERIHFYAFESWRPNTEMISVGLADDPERCIYVRGDHANKLNGWTEKFVFWVPV